MFRKNDIHSVFQPHSLGSIDVNYSYFQTNNSKIRMREKGKNNTNTKYQYLKVITSVIIIHIFPSSK
jgi:hypothetical protein